MLWNWCLALIVNLKHSKPIIPYLKVHTVKVGYLKFQGQGSDNKYHQGLLLHLDTYPWPKSLLNPSWDPQHKENFSGHRDVVLPQMNIPQKKALR